LTIYQHVSDVRLPADKMKEIPKQPAPLNLIYEEFGGETYYPKGYRQVLSGEKTEGDLIGSGVVQSLIVQALVFHLKTILPKKDYWVPTNKVGLHLGTKTNLINDIVIVEKSKLANPVSEKYFEVLPKFVIEVDVKIDTGQYPPDMETAMEWDYLGQKSTQLLLFDIAGIAWVFTKTRKIILATSLDDWFEYEWTETVPLFDGYGFCLQSILEEEGILAKGG